MKQSKEEVIIDYITVKLMEDNKFISHPHVRVRTAWIEAKKIFLKMSQANKDKIFATAKKRQSKDEFGTDGRMES